jgi:hypothetical protein
MCLDNVEGESGYLMQVFWYGCELPRFVGDQGVGLGNERFGQKREVHCWGRQEYRLLFWEWMFNRWILLHGLLSPNLCTRLIIDWDDFGWGLRIYQDRSGWLEEPCHW